MKLLASVCTQVIAGAGSEVAPVMSDTEADKLPLKKNRVCREGGNSEPFFGKPSRGCDEALFSEKKGYFSAKKRGFQ